MDYVLDGLNEAQKAAVTSEAKVLQVLAPPGSGKTKTLTARVGHLISHHGLEPRNIIVCTFTVKAAREMQERISGFLGKQNASRLVLGTFHSIARRYLAVYGSKIGLSEKFSIADTSDTMGIIKRIIKRGAHSIDAKVARARISSLKSQSVLSEQASASLKGVDQQEIARIYAEYEDHLKLSNLLDFDDLLLRCCELLRRFPSCVSNIEAVLIDEFQDTNNVQYDLMSLFSQKQQAITIVGDPDQSIYGWRNAEIRNLKKMQIQYPETHVAKLEENYRSSGAILLSAQEVIEQDQSRPSKRLMPTHSVGMRPVLRRVPDASAEAMWILSEIKRTSTLTGGLLRWNDYAILLRSAALSRHVESALGKAGIPYRMVGGHKFFDRMEVKLILDYLRVVTHQDNDETLKRILNVPLRKIGDATVTKLLDYAAAKKVTLWKVVLGVAQGNIRLTETISAPAQQGLESFVNIVLSSQKKLRSTGEEACSFTDLIQYLINKAGIEKYLRENKADDFEGRWANVQELVAQASDVSAEMLQGRYIEEELDDLNELQVQEACKANSLEEIVVHFLANVALSAENQKSTESKEATEQITISTIHAGKGLEWPVVFIPAVYDGSIPHSRAEDHDEERRLLYVAMTRAQALLYLSCPIGDSSGQDIKLSSFLAQKPMDSYFDKHGADIGFTVAKEVASILRRPCPGKSVINKAMADIEFARDDRWSLRRHHTADGEDHRSEPDEEVDASCRRHVRNDGFTNARTDQHVRSSRGSDGPSSSNSLQRQAAYSVSNAPYSTFVTATTAMTTLKAHHGQTQAMSLDNIARVQATSGKRRLKHQEQSSKGSGSLLGYLVSKPANETAKRPRTEDLGQGAVDDMASTEVPLSDITNTYSSTHASTHSHASSDLSAGTKPALTLHNTSMNQQSKPQVRKTLGMRRSMHGWPPQQNTEFRKP